MVALCPTKYPPRLSPPRFPNRDDQLLPSMSMMAFVASAHETNMKRCIGIKTFARRGETYDASGGRVVPPRLVRWHGQRTALPSVPAGVQRRPREAGEVEVVSAVLIPVLHGVGALECLMDTITKVFSLSMSKMPRGVSAVFRHSIPPGRRLGVAGLLEYSAFLPTLW